MSNTISLRLSEEDYQLVKDHARANNLSLSAWIRDLILDKLDDDEDIDEERILKAWKQAKREPTYDCETVWKMLGVD